jgi:hypothetical protein
MHFSLTATIRMHRTVVLVSVLSISCILSTSPIEDHPGYQSRCILKLRGGGHKRHSSAKAKASPSFIRHRRSNGRKSHGALQPESSSDSDQINVKRLAASLELTFNTELPKIYAQSVRNAGPRKPTDTAWGGASGVDYQQNNASEVPHFAAELTPERMALRRDAERLARLDLNLSSNLSAEDEDDD